MDDAERDQAIRTARGILAAPMSSVMKDAVIAELRAVLAPLLDDEGWAFHHSAPAGAYGIAECVFCGAACGDYGQPPLVHAPGCPVLRKDALLGR